MMKDERGLKIYVLFAMMIVYQRTIIIHITTTDPETIYRSKHKQDQQKTSLGGSWYEHAHAKYTNKNNNKQDITKESNKGTKPGSDRRVKEPRFEVLKLDLKPRLELLESSYYKIIIPDGYKYRNNYIISNLVNYVVQKTFVPIKYKENGKGAIFFIDDKKSNNCDTRMRNHY